MKEFSFGFGEEMREIIDEPVVKANEFGFDTVEVEEKEETNHGFGFNTVEVDKKEEVNHEFEVNQVEEEKIEEVNDTVENLFDIKEETINEDPVFTGIPAMGEERESDKYINAIHKFTEYMPLNLSIDRHLESEFTSLIDGNEPTIVIEKLESNMITMIHNLMVNPIPAITNELRQPVIKWNGTIEEFMITLEDEMSFRFSLQEGQFKSMKKIIIVENMNEKVDLDQNETYVTRQEVLNSLLNKYDSVIDLTENNCSINFKESNKRYNLNIGGLGYNNISSSWVEEIKYKIEFLRPRQILLTGIAAETSIANILKEEHNFNIVNEKALKSLALEM